MRFVSAVYALFGMVSVGITILLISKLHDIYTTLSMLTWNAIAVASLGFMLLIDYTRKSLAKGEKWAWVASLCLAVILLFSPFIPFALFMLWGLKDNEVKTFASK